MTKYNVGDILESKLTGKWYRVEQVSVERVLSVMDNDKWSNRSGTSVYCIEENFKPVELTDEILDQIFSHVSIGPTEQIWFIGSKFRIRFIDNVYNLETLIHGNLLALQIKKIKYLHELQHICTALKLPEVKI